MATKTQRFRRASERSGDLAPRNFSQRSARKEGVKLEESAGTPSRKSTRGSKGGTIVVGWNEEGIAAKRKAQGHVKAAAALTVRETMARRSPSERAKRGRKPSRGNAPAR
jgi:hypothetical protein